MDIRDLEPTPPAIDPRPETPYQVGRADSPNADDPRFEDEVQALGAAVAQSYDDTVIAIWLWQDDDVEIVCLVYQQTPYWP